MRLNLPGLRERRQDIPLLVRHILKTGRFNRGNDGQTVKGVGFDALEAMMRYEWPGNVRELTNVVERACSFADGEFIQLEDLPGYIGGTEAPQRRGNAQTTEPMRQPTVQVESHLTFKVAKERWLATFEKEYLGALLTKHSGNLSQAAREAEVDRKHFRRLSRKHGLIAARAAGKSG